MDVIVPHGPVRSKTAHRVKTTPIQNGQRRTPARALPGSPGGTSDAHPTGPLLPAPRRVPPRLPGQRRRGDHVVSVNGGGWFLFAGSIPIQFGFGAVLHRDGRATGSFHQSYEVDGLYVKYWGRLTCLTYDAADGRAWIGGVLTKVSTNDPDATQQPGDDAWFRVLDGGRLRRSVDDDRVRRGVRQLCGLLRRPAVARRQRPDAPGDVGPDLARRRRSSRAPSRRTVSYEYIRARNKTAATLLRSHDAAPRRPRA